MPSLSLPKPSAASSGPLDTAGSVDGLWVADGRGGFDDGESGGAEAWMLWVPVGSGTDGSGARPAVRFSGGLTLISVPSADITAVPSSAWSRIMVSPPATATTAAATPA